MASRATNELLPRYANYVWNRLMTVSAEDCASMVTTEIVALYDAWKKVNDATKDNSRGRVFFAKAIIILAKARHSRDADELNILVSDRISDRELDEAVDEATAPEVPLEEFDIPKYVYDVHTQRGKRMGKTKEDFLREEHDALLDGSSIFRNFDEMLGNASYVRPTVELDTKE